MNVKEARRSDVFMAGDLGQVHVATTLRHTGFSEHRLGHDKGGEIIES